ncbi:winged helix DNA-binding domain-containing protein [Kitasatospora sp. RB6PN24]|uniref:winged helix DNA-binding domain-containing protein n=1 Tax=Kitasatospora humi TaxID=2893891 RepID=UPI001E5CD2DD|nr:winged helix DNA-binding domain-containing protein [Kitasatospora humi]MCC9308159.1 winged helix DNA-binding domain-containing protein [Kitasatospora humi]
MTEPPFDRRALNRALLARQHLLAPAGSTPTELIDQLVGLQAQAADPPYYGLWSRLPAFRPEQLSELVARRQVVRLGLQRATIHLVTAADCLRLRPLFQPVLDQALSGARGRLLAGLDLDAVTARGRALVEERPRTFQELGVLLAADFPDRDPAALAQVIRARLALVQVPPRGLWRTGGAAAHTTAERWLGRDLDPVADPAAAREELLLRYLAAFGPATIADLQKWSGLTRWTAVVKRLRERLVEFRDEQGRALYDLPEAPRPEPATTAPVRLVAPFDNLLLSHADRTRVLPEAFRSRVMTANGIVLGTILVDGFVAGTWRLDRDQEAATAVLRPFGALSRSARAAAATEAERLLGFAAPEAERRRLRVERAD